MAYQGLLTKIPINRPWAALSAPISQTKMNACKQRRNLV